MSGDVHPDASWEQHGPGCKMDDGTPGFVAMEYRQRGGTCALVTAARLVVNACASIEGACPLFGEVQKRLAVLRYEHDKPEKSKNAIQYCKDKGCTTEWYLALPHGYPINCTCITVEDADHARTKLAKFLRSRSIAVGLGVDGCAGLKLLYPSLDSKKCAQTAKDGLPGHETVITAIDGDTIVLSDSNRPHRVELSWKELVAAATNVTLCYVVPTGAGKALSDGQVHARVLNATVKDTPVSTNATACVVPARICEVTGMCTTCPAGQDTTDKDTTNKHTTDERPTSKHFAFNDGVLETIVLVLCLLAAVCAIVFLLGRGTRQARVGSESVLRTVRARPGLSRAAHSLL